MSLPRFFLDTQILQNESTIEFALQLNGDDIKHISVLRLNPGEHIAVIDAASDYFECEIIRYESKLPVVRICSHDSSFAQDPYVVLVQSLAKADRFELVLRHATELGVRAFFPYSAHRSVAKINSTKISSKLARWNAILRSAAMQSGQLVLPQLYNPVGLLELCEWLQSCERVLICWEQASNTQPIKASLQNCDPTQFTSQHPLAIVIGPEGGLEQEEIDRMLASNSHASVVSLGRSILRTETAGIVAPALALYELGWLGGSCK